MQLSIRVHGRPAPQGSHELQRGRVAPVGEAYLHAWRTRAKQAAYEAYAAAGLARADLPLFGAGVPVVFEAVTFFMTEDQCRFAGSDEAVGTPDLDKLLRSTLDALRLAHLYADDAQVVMVNRLSKQRAHGQPPGALIIVREWEMQR